MSQQNQADTSGNFTEDIEATIDDLFTPVKEIEIDPLTNEIKDRAVGAQTAETQPADKAEASTGDIEPAPTAASEQEETALDQAQTAEAPTEEGGGFLDLELELDVDFEAEAPSEEDEKEAEVSDADLQAEEGILYKFSETIMSLEWEIKDETISEALTQAETLKQEYSDHQDPVIMELIGLMITLLGQMAQEPDQMPAVPTALKKAADALQNSISGHENTDAVRGAVQELETLAKAEGTPVSEQTADEIGLEADIELEPLAQVEDESLKETQTPESVTEQEAGAEEEATAPEKQKEQKEPAAEAEDSLSLEVETEEEPAAEEFEIEALEEAEAEAEPEETSEKPVEQAEIPEEEVSVEADETVSDTGREPPEVPENAEPESAFIPPVPPQGSSEATPSTSMTAEPQANEISGTLQEHNEFLKNTIQQHIKELESLSARIIPVEKLLSRTQGMEKLHAFQKGIRAALEKQKKNLAAAIQSGSADIPETQNEPVHEAKPESSSKAAPSPSGDKCPWDSVAVMTIGTTKIAVPAEEMAFAGAVSGRFRKKLQKESDFALSWLKPWPWIKIKPSLSGPLAELDEKELKDMKFPVLNSRVSEALDTEDTSEEFKKPAVIILYTSDGRAGVLYVENTPEIKEIAEDAVWSASSDKDQPVMGKIAQGSDTLTIISMSGHA